MIDSEKIVSLLKPDGLFARFVRAFESRPEQLSMLQDIIRAYNQSEIALVEAGTGTGKSLAYLLPAIVWAQQTKERTVISTHTIALQEQLLTKDIPLVLQALGVEIKATLVKGMSNYLCWRKFDEARLEKPYLPPEEKDELAHLEEWAHTTRDGSRSSLAVLPSYELWDRVCAESDTCTKRACPYYDKCFFFQARKQAEDAQILVVNHHLLFANLAADGAILPEYKRVILDEAHHIEDVATHYFADKASELGCLRIIGRLQAEKGTKSFGKLPILKEKILNYYQTRDVPAGVKTLLQRIAIDLPPLRHDLLKMIVDAFSTLNQFAHHFSSGEDLENKLRVREPHTTHPVWIQEVLPSIDRLLHVLQQYVHTIHHIEDDFTLIDDDALSAQTHGVRVEIKALTDRLALTCAHLTHFVGKKIDSNTVRWIEATRIKAKNYTSAVDAQLDISRRLADFLFIPFPTVVLCSATLTTHKGFHFIRQRLGLTSALLQEKTVTESIYDSPFDYEKQSLLVIPKDLPAPTDPSFLAHATEAIWQAIQASNGNAFVLFTSYNMLKEVYRLLEERLVDARFTLFKQGDAGRQKLLEQFKTTDRSILFGTDSFWEGVDVVGEALRCVIIVKLPFTVPSEPITEARAETIELNGGDAFWEYSLPRAIVKFKQGFGRLIRNKRDRGCVVCLDSRIISRNYGKLFLKNLPPSRILLEESPAIWEEMRAFYRHTYHLVNNA